MSKVSEFKKNKVYSCVINFDTIQRNNNTDINHVPGNHILSIKRLDRDVILIEVRNEEIAKLNVAKDKTPKTLISSTRDIIQTGINTPNYLGDINMSFFLKNNQLLKLEAKPNLVNKIVAISSVSTNAEEGVATETMQSQFLLIGYSLEVTQSKKIVLEVGKKRLNISHQLADYAEHVDVKTIRERNLGFKVREVKPVVVAPVTKTAAPQKKTTSTVTAKDAKIGSKKVASAATKTKTVSKKK